MLKVSDLVIVEILPLSYLATGERSFPEVYVSKGIIKIYLSLFR